MQHPMKPLAEAAFAADELRLFLDTHPQEQAALAAYRAAVRDTERHRSELPYSVNARDAGRCGQWDWVQTPFPWELEG